MKVETHTADSNGILRVSEERAEEIAVYVLALRYRMRGFDFTTHSLEDWCKYKSQKIDEKEDHLRVFLISVIIPATVTKWGLDVTDPMKAYHDLSHNGDIALKLLATEINWADQVGIKARLYDITTKNPSISLEELRSLMLHYLIPYATKWVASLPTTQ